MNVSFLIIQNIHHKGSDHLMRDETEKECHETEVWHPETTVCGCVLSEQAEEP